MEKDSINSKSMELIRKTKEFLQLNKTYDDMQNILIIIKQAQRSPESGTKLLPEKIRELIRSLGSYESVENLTLTKMRELKEKMSDLSREIRKLTEQLEPHSESSKQTNAEKRNTESKSSRQA